MVNIFIEAKDRKTSEAEFLTAILNRLGIPADTYSLKPTNGYTNLMDSDKAVNINAMRVNTDAGEKNLVVFDADSGNNNGGFEKRRDLLLKKKEELGLEFELFLWPVPVFERAPMLVCVPLLPVFTNGEHFCRRVPVSAYCMNDHLVLSVFVRRSSECHAQLYLRV